MEYRNAVFVITEEHACPRYTVGEEFFIHDSAISIDRDKQVCLMLVQQVLKALTETRPLQPRFTQSGMRRSKFECGGCTGMIRFEYKKENAYSTLQCNLLEVAKKRAKKQLVEESFGLLRKMELFELLDDFDLQELALLMKLRKYPANKVIIEAGEVGTHFYVILTGQVAVVKEDNKVVAELGPGEIFGEMSLLSGELTYPSVYSKTSVQLAALNAKDFKHVLSLYPALQVYFYRVLVNRAQENTMRAGNISSGMSGELSDINSVDLFQLINSGGKTGKVHFVSEECQAVTLFNEGEIVFCRYGEQEGKGAVFSLLAKQNGKFSYTKGLSEQEKALPILEGFMNLIMEGLRRLDEEQESKEESSEIRSESGENRNCSGITDTGIFPEHIDSDVDLFGILRKLKLLDPLDDSSLREISLLMKLKRYIADNVIIEERERGTHFYVILSGKVAVIRKDREIIAELGPGEVFGEMSLLSGGSTYTSVYSKTAVQLAALNAGDFKKVLFNYPNLQVFFYRLLMHRIRQYTILTDEVNSGMSGELSDINSLELFRIINSGGKSGRVDFSFDDGRAVIFFNAGEVVSCKYNEQEGKDAFFTLLARQQGRITYTENLSEEEKTLPLLGGFMGLIMEGLVRSEP